MLHRGLRIGVLKLAFQILEASQRLLLLAEVELRLPELAKQLRRVAAGLVRRGQGLELRLAEVAPLHDRQQGLAGLIAAELAESFDRRLADPRIGVDRRLAQRLGDGGPLLPIGRDLA